MNQITSSLIPSSESKPLRVLDSSVSSAQFDNLNKELEVIKSLANPLAIPKKYLAYLAYAFKVDFWSEDISEKSKRALIQNSFLLHSKKGTKWAIEKVFEALDMQANIKEWFEYNGKPFHFKIDLFLKDKAIHKNSVDVLEKYINIYKNVRSILEEIDIEAFPSTTLKISSYALCEATAYAPFKNSQSEAS